MNAETLDRKKLERLLACLRRHRELVAARATTARLHVAPKGELPKIHDFAVTVGLKISLCLLDRTPLSIARLANDLQASEKAVTAAIEALGAWGFLDQGDEHD